MGNRQAKKETKKKTKTDRAAAHTRLTDIAMKAPGVADIVRIYGQLAKVESAHNTYLGALTPVEVLSSTDSVYLR
jgi:hypothetical protein